MHGARYREEHNFSGKHPFWLKYKKEGFIVDNLNNNYVISGKYFKNRRKSKRG
jgi:hypothetical protein